MPKSIYNSKKCSCCGRLMPVAKRGKRKSCSRPCASAVASARRKARSRQPFARNAGHSTGRKAITEATS